MRSSWYAIEFRTKKRNNRTPDDACSIRPKNGRLADCRADNIAYEFKLSDQLYLLTNKEREWVTATKHVSYVKPNTSEAYWYILFQRGTERVYTKLSRSPDMGLKHIQELYDNWKD